MQGQSQGGMDPPAVKLEPSEDIGDAMYSGGLDRDAQDLVGAGDSLQPAHLDVEERELVGRRVGQWDKEAPDLAEVKVEIDVAEEPVVNANIGGETLNRASTANCSDGLPLPAQKRSQEEKCAAEVAARNATKPVNSGWSLRVQLKEEPVDLGYDQHQRTQEESTEANCGDSIGSNSLTSEALRHKSHLGRGIGTAEQKGEPSMLTPAPDDGLESLPIHFQSRSQSQGSSGSVSSFKCELCDAMFTQLSSLRSHMRIYCGEKPYKCDLCAAEFTRFSILKEHMDTHVVKSQTASDGKPGGAQSSNAQSSMASYCGEKPYKCKSCPAVFTWSFQLKTHIGIHSGEKAFKCTSCPASFKTNSNLKDHLRIHSGEKPYKCEHCPSAFARSTHLKRHSRTHSGEKPYKCGLCPSSFKQSIDLTRHMTIHTGEKPYKCEQCPAAFVRSWELKVHFRTHTGEKPYKCEHCPAAFTVLSALKIHTRLHSGDKPYACQFCPAAYTQSANLKSHMKKHNGQAVYRCGLCTSVFLESRNLQNHVMLMHNIEKIRSEQSPEKTDLTQGLENLGAGVKG